MTDYGGSLDSNDDLTKSGNAAASLLAKAAAVFAAGFLVAHIVSPAQAAVPNDIRAELAALHDDMLLIKCRLGIEVRCPSPPPPPVRAAGPP